MTHLQKESILKYSGNISFEKINELLDQYKIEAEALGINPVTTKRLYAILVEGLENAYRHKLHSIDNNDFNIVAFDLIYSESDIIVKVGNYTIPENIERLKQKVDSLNKLSVKGISSLYKESIAKAKISAKGGAGLGLIEIARNSRQILKCDYKDIKSNISYFDFTITISQNPKKEKKI